MAGDRVLLKRKGLVLTFKPPDESGSSFNRNWFQTWLLVKISKKGVGWNKRVEKEWNYFGKNPVLTSAALCARLKFLLKVRYRYHTGGLVYIGIWKCTVV